MADRFSAQVDLTSAAWVLIWDAADRGGPCREIEIENTGDSELEWLVDPVNWQGASTPTGGKSGRLVAAGAKDKVISAQGFIRKVYARYIGAETIYNIGPSAT